MRWSVLSLVAVTALATLQVAASLPALPSELATHFGWGGVADGWMSRGAFVAFTAGLWLFVVATFWGLAALLPSIDPAWINVPHSEHWLRGAERDRSLRAIATRMHVLGVVSLLGVVAMNEAVFAANRLPEPRLNEPGVWLGVGAYLAFTVGWCVELMRRFPSPE